MKEALAKRAAEAIQESGKKFVGGGAAFSAAPENFFAWNDPLQPPAKSVLDNAVEFYAARELNERVTKVEQDRLKDGIKTMNASAQAKQTAEKTFKDETQKIPGTIAAQVGKAQTNYDNRLKDFQGTQDTSRKSVQDSADKYAAAELINKRQAELIATLKSTNNLLRDREINLIDPFQFDKPQGRILRRYSDTLVDIDLGSSDKVRPGLAFSIFPSDTVVRGMQPRNRNFTDFEGKILQRPVPKGLIEVVDVIGPNIAQCRITTEDSPVRDRVIVGDLLYNALWRKGSSEHIALFGIFDLDGDGRDDVLNLIQGLRRVGVVVDAYYDIGKGKWEGEITSQTNFGLEGYSPTLTAADGNSAGKLRIAGLISDARKQVKDRGIRILRPIEFFPRIGFNARMDVNADAINQAATAYSRAQADKPAEGNAAPGEPMKN
jgi:hypothetical protein